MSKHPKKKAFIYKNDDSHNVFLFDKRTKELLAAYLLEGGGKGDMARQVIYIYENDTLIGMRTVTSYRGQRSPAREEYILRNGQVMIRNSYGSAKENMDGYLRMADSIRIVGIKAIAEKYP